MTTLDLSELRQREERSICGGWVCAVTRDELLRLVRIAEAAMAIREAERYPDIKAWNAGQDAMDSALEGVKP